MMGLSYGEYSPDTYDGKNTDRDTSKNHHRDLLSVHQILKRYEKTDDFLLQRIEHLSSFVRMGGVKPTDLSCQRIRLFCLYKDEHINTLLYRLSYHPPTVMMLKDFAPIRYSEFRMGFSGHGTLACL